ncbi:tetratricopeptide repeat protein [Phenylobacterium sp. LjRoot225]|uniref:glycosyltransferase family 9 protein n=1 Tax=Phenylobacterium sp. LjRoot225 TaxID=3342285 RepID=UPI003ECDB13E
MSAAIPVAPPVWVEDLFQQADAARREGRLALALAMYRRVVAAWPDHPIALQHLGAVLNVLGERPEAERVLHHATAVNPRDPAARHALGVALMGQGRYAEAGPLYAARFDLPQLGLQRPAGLPCPEWRGEPLAGKQLAVFPEMGLGDAIQHARFAALLRDRGAHVSLLCLPALARLFADSLPGVHVAAAAGKAEFPDPDYWAMSGALMFMPGMSLETLPAAPYLRAPRPLADGPAPTRPPGLRIGLVTAGNPEHKNDANRSLSPQLAAGLRAALPGQIVDLAPAATGARDFADTAAVMSDLDLVVSVDTSAAHLAGALGKRAFVLIPAINTDWRWMHGRTDSPWYPSLRLYRADLRAGWAPAIERLVSDVQAEFGGG